MKELFNFIQCGVKPMTEDALLESGKEGVMNQNGES
ncbi:hypothetical protein J2736_002135 [Paenibacillus qinlingensis]|uniref:Uncharacterized protein n=1 Tax=Paenibacillus qinlingensis TaxID=1837343 RepID=A0ABU1NTY6_9BACL|nr:hypothetical protein [Paenibacillus qinlingensis]